MKTLIVEMSDPDRFGELVTVSKQFCDTPDIVVLGKGDVPGTFGKAFQTSETVSANLVSSISELVEKEGYEIIIMSATTIGTGLTGPLAVSISGSLISEVTGVLPDLVIERPLYGSKAVMRCKIEKKPLILTVRRKYFEKDMLEGTTKTTELSCGPEKVILLGETEEKQEGIPLEDADVIVTGGRGIGNANNFAMLQDMATPLNGAVGASRGAVDEGWMPPTFQIGQTGKIVAPSVYFAVGVSGASQHLAGIANAKCVVGINKDEEANIFNRARFGIVMDYRKAVPALIKALKE
jgi:electron transfer flavoprotein alpha subunit